MKSREEEGGVEERARDFSPGVGVPGGGVGVDPLRCEAPTRCPHVAWLPQDSGP
jgi:hypothetical protein